MSGLVMPEARGEDRMSKSEAADCAIRGHRFSALDRTRCIRCGHVDEPVRPIGRGRPTNWTADLDSYLVECRTQRRSLLETSEILGLSPLTCSAREWTLRYHPELMARATDRMAERQAGGDTWLAEIAAQRIMERAK